MTNVITRSRREQSVNLDTPWGPAQHVKELAPGIVCVSTSSHGGYLLSPEAWAAMPYELANIDPWACRFAYEEDEDWAIVALAYADLFSDYELYCAYCTAKRARWNVTAENWLNDLPAGQAVTTRVVKWSHEHADDYLKGGGCTSKEGWIQYWARIKDGMRIETCYPRLIEAPPSPATIDQLTPYIVKMG